RRQALHDDGEERRIVMMDLGDPPADMPAMLAEAFMFEEGALEPQRPALADHPNIGQRLLDADAAGWALDQEDEVEIAVADLGNPPVRRCPAETRCDPRQAGEESRQRALAERAIARRRFERHRLLLWPGQRAIFAIPPRDGKLARRPFRHAN